LLNDENISLHLAEMLKVLTWLVMPFSSYGDWKHDSKRLHIIGP
jgi:hypothetical protein